MVLETHQEAVAEQSQPTVESNTPLQAKRGAETVPLFTPLTRAPADTADLRATRDALQASAGTINRGTYAFAVQDLKAQSLIREMDASNLSTYAQIQALMSTHDEGGKLLDTDDARIAYARRIDWNSTHSESQEYQRYVSPEQCIAYGMVAFNLNKNQLLAMLHTVPDDSMQPDLMKLDFAKGKFGLDHICAFFRHSDFENVPDRYSSYPFAARRSIEMYGIKYEVYRDLGKNLEIFVPNTTDYFVVPKSVVEKYNKHTVSEKVPAKVDAVVDNIVGTVQISAIMLLQLGAIHPAYVNGRLTWVLEPWARIAMDETDENNGAHHFSADNKYTGLFEQMRKERGNKRITITAEDMAGLAGNTKGYATDIPTVAVVGLSLKMVDHHRINGALSANTPIEVFLHFGDISFR